MNIRIDGIKHFETNPISNPKTNPSKTQFSQVLAAQQNTALSDLKQDLKRISQDLQSGKISQEEASKNFTCLVVEKRNQLGLTPEQINNIQNTLAELMSTDPSFGPKLTRELKKL